MRVVSRKGIVTTSEVDAGEIFTSNNLGVKKPGKGLSPKYFDLVVGRKSKVDLPKDTVVTWDAVLGPRVKDL
jgi:sialic acid synthase SpsE